MSTGYDDTETETDTDVHTFLATLVGYGIGFGSLLLYTPIAIRLVRQRHADGLTISTWWLKCTSYVLSDIYYLRRAYVVSTYAETLIITLEATLILFLVAYYQHQCPCRRQYAAYWWCWCCWSPFWCCAIFFVTGMILMSTVASLEWTALGQLSSAFINVAALVPQFYYNYQHQTKGDYSPWTALLAAVGCFLRLQTTRILNDNDPVLVVTFGLALLVNGALLVQIVYYGVAVEHLTLREVLCADIQTEHNTTTTGNGMTSTTTPPYDSGVALPTLGLTRGDSSSTGIRTSEGDPLQQSYHNIHHEGGEDDPDPTTIMDTTRTHNYSNSSFSSSRTVSSDDKSR